MVRISDILLICALLLAGNQLSDANSCITRGRQTYHIGAMLDGQEAYNGIDAIICTIVYRSVSRRVMDIPSSCANVSCFVAI